MGYDPELEEILNSIKNKTYEHKTTPIDLPPPKPREHFEAVEKEEPPAPEKEEKEDIKAVPEKPEEKKPVEKREKPIKEKKPKPEKAKKIKAEKPIKEKAEKVKKENGRKPKSDKKKKPLPVKTKLIIAVAAAALITAGALIAKGAYVHSLEAKYNVTFPKGVPMAFYDYYGENKTFAGLIEISDNESVTPVYSEPKSGKALFEKGSDVNADQHYRAAALSKSDADLEAMYSTGDGFLKASQSFTFNTLYGKKEKYQVIAAYIVNTKPEADNGYAFPYNLYGNLTYESYNHYQDTIKCRSLYTTGYKIEYGDYCMTLSVPSDVMPDFRFVIVGVKKDKPQKITEVKENPRIRYPQIYCDREGIRNIYARFSSKWYPEIVTNDQTGDTVQLTPDDFY